MFFGFFKKSSYGFTLAEVVLVVFILALLSAIVLTNYPVLKKSIDLNATLQEMAAVFRLAQSRAASSENNSDYGVYFNDTVSPVKYTLFKGSSYATRTVSADQNYYFPSKRIVIFSMTMTPSGSKEVVFSKLTGVPTKYGSIMLRSPAITRGDSDLFKAITVQNTGVLNTEATNGDVDRIKDSRHVTFAYKRTIDTSTESITFNYNNSQVVHTYPINAYLLNNQIEITDTATVGGTNQTVRVRTYLLNNPGPTTSFGIYRDKRYNDKSVVITISGDSTGALAQYSADGVTVTSPSTYVIPTITTSSWY